VQPVTPLPASEPGASEPGQATAARLAWLGSAPVASPPTVSPVANPDKPREISPARMATGAGSAAKHLGEAVHLLRVEHTPEAALALLDRHATELTQRKLGHEALILRVEALLALGRQEQVLRLLDSAALSDVAASHSLLVTRGKLRAAVNRCADGVGDFNLVLAESRKPEREALFGRAICHKQLGDMAGARTDLERYRREFPADPRLPELERRLGNLP
jgi:Flp pilus assembly protein TadD